MKFFLILFVLQAGFLLAYPQNTIVFRGQLYHNQTGPARKVRVMVNNQYPALTDESGNFQLSIPKTLTAVRISLPLSNNHILYPAGGYVPVPRDPKDVQQIIIGNRKDNIYLAPYLALYKQKKADSSNTAMAQPLQRKLDSLQSLLVKSHFSESEIKTAEKLQDGKDETVNQVINDLVDFRNAAREMVVSYKNLSPLAFENGEAMDLLLQAVKDYNADYNKLDKMRKVYEGRIADYWQNDSLSRAFTGAAEYDINFIHPERIYPIQELILQVRQFYTGKKKNKNMKKLLEQAIEKSLRQMDPALQEMERRTNIFIQLVND